MMSQYSNGIDFLSIQRHSIDLLKEDSGSNEITAEDLLKQNIEKIPCLIEPLFHRVGLAAVVGSSDVGKSAFLRQLALAIATGEETFLGFPVLARHQSAIYVSTEDDQSAMAYLLHVQNKAKKLPVERCKSLRFVFDTGDLLNELNRRLTAKPADLVVIDAFGDLYDKDQNKTNQIRGFLNDYHQLAQQHECLILFLHHTGKRTEEQAPSKHHIIGGQGFEGKMRLVIELRMDPYDPALRHLCVVKGNYLPAVEKQQSYELRFVDFLFYPTGERATLESLVKPKADEDRAKYDKARGLRDAGQSMDDIAKQLGYANRSSVFKLLKRYDTNE